MERLFKITVWSIMLLITSGCAQYVALEAAGVVYDAMTSDKDSPSSTMQSWSDDQICNKATADGMWERRNEWKKYVDEANRRGLDCGIGSGSQIANVQKAQNSSPPTKLADWEVCSKATTKFRGRKVWEPSKFFADAVIEADKRGLECGVGETNENLPEVTDLPDRAICARAVMSLGYDKKIWEITPKWRPFVQEAKRRGLDCGVGSSPQIAKAPTESESRKPTSQIKSSVEVGETTEIQNLRDRLAQLEAEKNATQQAISQDTQSPSIRINNATSDDAKGVISGVATDNTGVAEIRVDGEIVPIDGSGRFTTNIFIPVEGKSVEVVAFDLKGLSTTETIRLERSRRTQQVSRLAAVNPLLGPKQRPSRDRVGLIIGVEDYARAPSADYASGDAKMFADYAREKLGIADNNIKTLSDTGASKAEILRALKVWLPKAVKPDATDLYVFYAGHGMPTADGTSAYLVPYDGDIQLLEDTAISRKRFFDEISATKPRSATFFFDNCFSGATRSEELLLASRPLGIKVQETSIPDNYLVFAAGETDQIAGVEPEVKHGRFSYFVFKGLEGEADANSDGKISAGELHKYVRESVGRFSAGAQTPTMLGDAGRWVLR
jgi:hypothetical protein